LAAMARVNSGCKVIEQNLLELDLPRSHFDGVFANAVLFHVPGQVLPRVLKELHATLKPGGVLFSSNPRGDGQEGWLKPTATMQFGISGMKMVRINTCRRATKSVGSGRAE